ncbi:MAG: hypothetical protein WC756_03575 [Taibaiella sp.]|jgi:hypothetical protein
MNFKQFNSWEDICKHKGVDPVQSLPFPEPTTSYEVGMNAFHKVTTIREVLNEGTEHDGYYYYPWFDRSGGGFSFVGYRCAYTGSRVGARLSYNTSDIATHAGKTFIEEYKELHNL